jgi:hypothetical protein
MPDTDERPFAPPDDSDEAASEDQDYVFRFRVTPPTAGEQSYSDPLVELIRGQLADMLDAAVLTDHGRRVRVDGFRLLQDPDTQYDVFPQSGGDQRTEPGASIDRS